MRHAGPDEKPRARGRWAAIVGVVCGAWVLASSALPALAAPPTTHVTVSASQFAPGQTLTLGLDAQNPDGNSAADLYAGVLLPDGRTALFFTSSATLAAAVSLDAPSRFSPMRPVGSGSVVSLPTFFRFTFPAAGITAGTYQIFSALVRQGALGDNRIDPGDVLAIDVKSVTFSGSVSGRSFPSGVYYSQPSLQHPGGSLQLLDGSLPVPVDFTGIGFDVSPDFVVSAENDTLTLHHADGTLQHVQVPGLYAMGRPSLSPDGSKVAVQATETPITPTTTFPQFLTIYIVDLATGRFTRLVPTSSNPLTGNEIPKWFPSGDRIAHQGIEPDPVLVGCIIVRVYDVAAASPLLTIRKNGTTGCYQPVHGIQDGPRFHHVVSHDNSRLLIVGQMQIYDASTGALLADLHQTVLDGLAAAGYQPDSRFPGQGGGGTFPLDGTFSVDGSSIIFDGAVQRNGTYGVLLMRINVDGSGFTILRDPITVDPIFSNNHNFSQLNPVAK